jgi:hypothetical protein
VSAANYDLNEIMDSLAQVFRGQETGDDFGGVAEAFSAYSEVPGQIKVPAIVLEEDGLDWDLDMGDGADEIQIVATVLLKTNQTLGAQRSLRSFLSRKPSAGSVRLKAALKANQTLGGRVSYAHMRTVRRFGLINFGGVDYQGAEIVIEVMS